MLGLALLLVLAFFLPAFGRLAWWCQRDQRRRWYCEDCSATGLLPDPSNQPSAAVYILSARTSGLKGALASHSWIVLRRPGSRTYERYDKMGWGDVIWRDGFAPDALWFGNAPVIEHRLEGAAAADAIPAIDAAVADYPHQGPGAYRAWPGPNSNSFVAHVMRAAPQLGRMPATAIGRDFARGVSLAWRPGLRQFDLRLSAYFGFTIGPRILELHMLGLVGGFDLDRQALLIPAFGAVRYGAPKIQAERSDKSPATSSMLEI